MTTPMPAQPVEAPPAAPAAPPATPAPIHQPIHPVHHVPRPSPLEVLFSAKIIAIMVLIGVILLFVGAILAVNAKVTEPVDNDIDEINESKENAFTQYKTGVTVMIVGCLLLVMFLLCGSVMSQNVPTNVKLGFLIFCAVIIFMTATIVLGFTYPLQDTGPNIFE